MNLNYIFQDLAFGVQDKNVIFDFAQQEFLGIIYDKTISATSVINNFPITFVITLGTMDDEWGPVESAPAETQNVSTHFPLLFQQNYFLHKMYLYKID